MAFCYIYLFIVIAVLTVKYYVKNKLSQKNKERFHKIKSSIKDRINHIEETDENEYHKFNYGLAILRIWMCFEVVIDHFKNWNGATLETLNGPSCMLMRYGGIAVPIFMLSSFILTDMNTLAHNNSKIKHRFYRLLIPHIFWAISYFLIYWIMDHLWNLGLEHGILDLFWQLILGHSINQTLWFQVDLIALTALFIIIFKFCNERRAIIVTMLIGYLSIFLQYSEKNGSLFDNVVWPNNINPDYIIYPIGRFCEMIPYVVVGILICNYGGLRWLRDKRGFTVIGSFLVLYLLFHFAFFITPRGYGYSGVYNLVVGLFSILMFYCLPFDKLPSVFLRIIKFVAKYTMAIYFMHRLVATLIYNTQLSVWFRMKQGSTYDCVIIFLCSLLGAWIISKVPIKFFKDAVT